MKNKKELLNKNTNIRNEIIELQNAMLKTKGVLIGDNEKCPLKHNFGDELYVREIFMPKGMLIVSKIHKYKHPYFILKGEVSVISDEGSVRIKAPYYNMTPRNTKRALYIHEDTIWVTVHKTNKTVLSEIEEEIIEKEELLNTDFVEYELKKILKKEVL